VSEGVGLIPGNHRAKGLLNAVLRRATEMVTSRPLTPEERATWISGTGATRDSLSTPHRIALQNRWLLESTQALFPPDAASRMLLMSGVPRWLSEALLESLDQREHDAVLLAAAEPPAIWFRITARNQSGARESLKEWPTEWAPEQEDGKRPDGFTVASDHVPLVLNSQAFRSGGITVQDLAAQLPAMVAAPKQGWKCLDLCAAPGGKTVQLAEAIGPKGSVIAVDISGDRLRSVKQNVDRMGLSNTRGIVADATTATLPESGTYDLALADVPCSNTGVMGRRIEVKFRLSSKDAVELKPIQLAILTNAAKHLKPGGILVHSTCSLLDSENGALVREFLETQGGDTSGWRMLDERLTIPLAGSHDGGYVSVLKKP
jgi:16S rRNA (cytosine967-C5)-methyltransferase